MRVICRDDSGRPAEVIPLSKWVKKGNPYTIVGAFTDMNGTETVILEEIDMTGLQPYKGFAATRFSIPTPDETLQLELEEIQEEELTLTH